MGIFDSFSISASGLTAERLRLDLTANNIANVNSTGRPNDPANPPYRRKIPIFVQMLEQAGDSGALRSRFKGAGVRVARVLDDDGPPSEEGGHIFPVGIMMKIYFC